MKPPLKLSSIDQEHLQELYNAAGIARDELPYTPSFEEIWQGFQDRTFKNASRDQVFGALLKYTRSSTNAASTEETPAVPLTDDQKKTLKILLPRHARGTKLLPYSDEFEAAFKEFSAHSNTTLTEQEFWRAISGGASGKRRPPVKKAAKVAVEADSDDEDGE
jgi:hypothetical protein